MEKIWSCTYGQIEVITDNDMGYDWDRKDEKFQLCWTPPELSYDKEV